MRTLGIVSLLLVAVLAAGRGSLDPGRAEAQPIAGATYAGTHSGGGTFTLTLSADGAYVDRWFVGDPGEACPLFESLEWFVDAPIQNHSFTYDNPVWTLTGSFPNMGTAEGSLAFHYEPCFGTLTWTALAGAPPPPPPPTLPPSLGLPPPSTPAPGPPPPLAECPPGSECVALVAGCQIVASTEDLDTATLRDRFAPDYGSLWLLDVASGRWLGDSPAAGAAMQGPNDLPDVDKLDGFFVCMPEGGGTFERAAI